MFRTILQVILGRIPRHLGSLFLYALLLFLTSQDRGVTLGFSNIFRDHPEVQTSIWAALNSPALWTNFFLMFLTCVLLVYPVFEEIFSTPSTERGNEEPLTRSRAALFLALVAVLYGLLFWRWLYMDPTPFEPGAFLMPAEIWRAVLGAVLGLVVFGGLAKTLLEKRWQLALARRFEAWVTANESKWWIKMFVAEPPKEAAAYQDAYRMFVSRDRVSRYEQVFTTLSLTLPLFLLSLLPFFSARVITAVALFGLITVVFSVLKLVSTLPPVFRTSVVVLSGLGIWWAFSQNAVDTPFKHRFPGMASYYADTVELDEDFAAVEYGESCREEPDASPSGLVPIEASLEAWKRHAGAAQGRERPVMVLVATSGGAYRASFWTTLALDRLIASNGSDELAGIADSVRFITGASGGMVGAGYFAALTPEGGWSEAQETVSLSAALADDIKAAQSGLTRHAVPNDTLSVVSQQIIQEDLENIILPARFAESDRGRLLESHWTRLNVPFDEWSAGERNGWRPSMIVSPMVIETGQLTLISNLDLSEYDRSLANEATEFFKVFPCARSTFAVGTAVRMNATFPYISPAVALPTSPPIRVVDTGYYDNFGITVIADLLSERTPGCKGDGFCLRDWLRANTSGVHLIELRAFALNTALERHGPNGTERCVPQGDAAPPTPGAQTGFGFLTSPVEAVLSARSRAMVSRNEDSLSAVVSSAERGVSLPAQNAYLDVAGYPILRTVLANCLTSAGSLNWVLPPDELNEMKAAMESQWAWNRDDIVRFWAEPDFAPPFGPNLPREVVR